jgi:predicted nucleic acid-binding protein
MLDTTVLLAGTIWPRWPYAVLQHALRGDFQLIIAPIGLLEARRKFRERFPTHLQAFNEFLEACDYEITNDPTAEEVLAHRDLMRDIYDVPLALAAISAQVDYFVSEDKDFTEPTPHNAQLHSRLQICLPGTFLREVMGWSSEELEQLRGRSWADLTGAGES